MNHKSYKSITEVSKILNLKPHVIRYWDSRLDGISTRLGEKKRRFFSISNIKKLKSLKDKLYNKGKPHHSLDLADKLIAKKHTSGKEDNSSMIITSTNPAIEKLEEISNNLKNILKKD